LPLISSLSLRAASSLGTDLIHVFASSKLSARRRDLDGHRGLTWAYSSYRIFVWFLDKFVVFGVQPKVSLNSSFSRRRARLGTNPKSRYGRRDVASCLEPVISPGFSVRQNLDSDSHNQANLFTRSNCGHESGFFVRPTMSTYAAAVFISTSSAPWEPARPPRHY
jgi:hypothetical protein